jgi:hypothetical protein
MTTKTDEITTTPAAIEAAFRSWYTDSDEHPENYNPTGDPDYPWIAAFFIALLDGVPVDDARAVEVAA